MGSSVFLRSMNSAITSFHFPLRQQRRFGGRFYNELPQPVADSIDDFEIDYDVIEGATDKELKEFF